MKFLVFISVSVAALFLFSSVRVSEGSCACTLIYDPVCGSDGVTYGSPCNFECERKNNNTELKMVSEGECEDSTEDKA
ncbi:Serine protease inhibitor Kazal-type 4 [Orchesella cincta]|uniref:Serine protease inhibitor Kazal-type 4 n=1 Tax=Orchesella cincta TaxID=48709 RepID=A0A1D2N2U8_ORCCI|nr:Serine protease inhibitor Kazal-type 4 [Orchesella cincta]